MNRKQRRASQALARPYRGASSPGGIPAGFTEGVRHLQAGRLHDAERAYESVLAKYPRHALSLHHLGLVSFKLGAKEQAVERIRASLDADPSDAKAWLNLAVILSDMRRHHDGIAACRTSISRDGTSGEAHKVLGDLLCAIRDFTGAAEAFGRAIELEPQRHEVRIRYARALVEIGRLDEATLQCDTVLKRDPANADAKILKLEIAGASQSTDVLAAALTLDGPDALAQPEHLGRIGTSLRMRGRHSEALVAFERAAAQEPGNSRWHFGIASALDSLGHYDRAFGACKTALDLDPHNAEGYVQLGLILRKLEMYDGAITAFEHATTLDSASSTAFHNLATTYNMLGRPDEAKAMFERAVNSTANALLSRIELCHMRRTLCDWDGLDAEEAACLASFRSGTDVIPPFMLLSMPEATAADQLEAARRYAAKFAAPPAERFTSYTPPGATQRRLRIGYLSSDFCKHATALLLAEVLELHDRAKFEIFGYCYSKDDSSALRRRVVSAFDHFVEIRALPHADAARRIHDDGIDVLVDLKGYTRDSRPEIVSYRPAPVQVNYLGYPATMGADFVDYLLADGTTAPLSHQPNYSERIVHFAASYQPNDRSRRIADTAPTRSMEGLPEDAFVFCSFNGSWKINGMMFDVWMRLLKETPRSVLWLLCQHEATRQNLRREAASRGVDGDRLVFASSVPNDQHLARHRLGDLFLDSIPCNAHTTASDALWAGLPVLTCLGRTFAARVAASLLNAVDLPDLVCTSLDDYERLALDLARDSGRLDGIRRKLAENRARSALFDTERYTRNLETAYETMAVRWRQGLMPGPFSVT